MSDNSSVVPVTPKISTEQYAGIASFDDALALVREVMGGEIIDAQDLGDGFALLNDKNLLIGVPFIILAAVESSGDNGQFVSMRVVTQDGRKYVINDGGTGIYAQIKMLWEKDPSTMGKPFLCRNGLRASTYQHPEHGLSTTHYLDTSAQSVKG